MNNVERQERARFRFGYMKMLLLIAACAVFVLWATWEIPMHVLSERPVITASALLIGGLLIVVGLLRGERFTKDSIRNALTLIVAGVVSLLFVTILRGIDHLAFVVLAGVICLAASIALVVVERSRRFLAAGVQTLLLLYVWGLVPLWCMGVANDWL